MVNGYINFPSEIVNALSSGNYIKRDELVYEYRLDMPYEEIWKRSINDLNKPVLCCRINIIEDGIAIEPCFVDVARVGILDDITTVINSSLITITTNDDGYGFILTIKEV